MAGFCISAAVLVGLATLAAGAPGSSSIRDLEAEIVALDARAATAAAERESAATRAEANRAAIGRNNRDIRDVTSARSSAEKRLADRLVSIYTSDPLSLAQILLSSESVSGALARYRFHEEVARNDAALAESLVESDNRLRSLRTKLAKERSARADALAESEARLSEVRGLVASRRTVLDRARAALAAADAQARARRLAQEQAARERAAAAGQATAAAPPPAPAPPPSNSGSSPDSAMLAHLARIAQCESGGNPQALSSSGLYRGKYQFDIPTWESVGGSGDPIDATEAEQDLRAQILYERRGPGPWPVCGA